MTIDKATMDSASDMINYRMIDVLTDWIQKEKINLDHFIADPQGHVNYNPYVIFDFTALGQRSTLLGQATNLLTEMSQYKQGNPNYTRAQYDYAQDNVPVVIFQRLYEWMGQRIQEMEKFLTDTNSVAPISDYEGLYTFDSNKYMTELQVYKDSYTGLATVIQYKIENEPAPTPPPSGNTSGGTVSGNTV